jgi:diadenosine tetraphosphate (Ap4A) HIT family hydrolase
MPGTSHPRFNGRMSCLMCAAADGDAELGRVEVWSDDLWRLTTSIGPGDPTPGFSYLEPRRHIPHVADLDGAEAATFGPTLARCTAALKESTGCELVYVYVFGGGIPHLHVHLAPHTDGDALNDSMLRGEFEEQPLPSGATAYVSLDFPSLPNEELRAVAQRVRALLAG